MARDSEPEFAPKGAQSVRVSCANIARLLEAAGGGSESGNGVATKRTGSPLDSLFFLLARRKGLEPLTFWFVAKHSIQLS